MRKNLISELTFTFSLKIIKLYQDLTKTHEYIISKQLLRSSTSIGANVEEAIAAFSKKDFVYKMSIASKEARETHYWLRLLKESSLTHRDLKSYIDNNQRIIKVLTSIVKTTTDRLENNPKFIIQNS
jgi:four helix bundle protein